MRAPTGAGRRAGMEKRPRTLPDPDTNRRNGTPGQAVNGDCASAVQSGRAPPSIGRG